MGLWLKVATQLTPCLKSMQKSHKPHISATADQLSTVTQSLTWWEIQEECIVWYSYSCGLYSFAWKNRASNTVLVLKKFPLITSCLGEECEWLSIVLFSLMCQPKLYILPSWFYYLIILKTLNKNIQIFSKENCNNCTTHTCISFEL